MTRCVNSQMIERNGKMLADSGFGMVAHACYIMSGKEVKDALVPGTLSQCFKIGKTIREANEVGKDPVAAAVMFWQKRRWSKKRERPSTACTMARWSWKVWTSLLAIPISCGSRMSIM